MQVFDYIVSYDNGECFVDIPELEGKTLIKMPMDSWEYDRLIYEKYEYDIDFINISSKVFSTIDIRKIGGNSGSCKATSYYTKPNTWEIEYIVKKMISTTLGIKDFRLQRRRLTKERLIEELNKKSKLSRES